MQKRARRLLGGGGQLQRTFLVTVMFIKESLFIHVSTQRTKSQTSMSTSFVVKSVNVVARCYPSPLDTKPHSDAWNCGLCQGSLGLAPSVEPSGQWRGTACEDCKNVFHLACQQVYSTTQGDCCPRCKMTSLKEFPISTTL